MEVEFTESFMMHAMEITGFYFTEFVAKIPSN